MPSHSYPPGVLNANWFGVFNAVSFQITLGAPMILFARSLGATATVLGIVAALTPLLTIFQIPAAYYLEQVGYKRMILLGWGLRTVLIFALALVPLCGFLGAPSQMALVLLGLFFFNLLRGISSGAWLPWITEILPDGVRGRFLARDQVFVQGGSLIALLVTAWVLGSEPGPGRFAIAFVISGIGGVLSLLFLQRIPDLASPESRKRSGQRVPWASMIAFQPFARLLMYNLLFVLTLGGLGAFSVAYLKSVAGFPDSRILLLMSLTFVAAAGAAPPLRVLLDRVGAKPVLGMAMALFLAVLAGWWALAAGVLPQGLFAVGLLYAMTGVSWTMFSVANLQTLMAIMPPMGRNHFFAVFTVATSLGLGAAPVAWGLMIDRIGTFTAQTFGAEWNGFSIYFAGAATFALAALLYTPWLVEKVGPEPSEGASDNLLQARLRRLTRHWQR